MENLLKKIWDKLHKNKYAIKLITLILSVLFSLVITRRFDSVLISGDMQDFFVRDGVEHIFTQTELYSHLKDFSVNGNTITSTSNDPWILLDTEDVKPFKYIKIDIYLNSPKILEAQFYYLLPGKSYLSEDDSRKTVLKNGANYVRIPRAKHRLIRLDLAGQSGYSLQVKQVALTNRFIPSMAGITVLVLLNIIWCIIFFFIIFKFNRYKDIILNNKFEVVKLIFSTMLILYTVIPMLLTMRYVVPAWDDIETRVGRGVVEYYGFNMLLRGFLMARHLYSTWQGTYFGNFLYGLGIPIYFGIKGVQLGCLIIFINFIASIYFLIRNVMKYLLNNVKYCNRLMVYSLALFLCTQMRHPFELFFWYTGGGYQTLIATFIWSISCIIVSLYETGNKSKKFMVLAILTLFLSCGGTLFVVAMIFASMTFSLLISYVFAFKKRKIILILWIMTALGTMINLLSPGNFIRFKADAHPYSTPLLGFIQTLNVFFQRLAADTVNTCIFPIGIGLILLFYTLHKKHNTHNRYTHPILFLIITSTIYLSGLFVLVYLNSDGKFDTTRYQSTMFIFFSFIIIANCFYFSGWIANKSGTSFLSLPVNIILNIMLVFTLFVSININPITNWVSYRLSLDLASHSIQNSYRERERIFLSLENAETKDPVILLPTHTNWYVHYMPILLDNPNYYMNKNMAGLFGLNSVTGYYENTE
jgi:hypothetical protein